MSFVDGVLDAGGISQAVTPGLDPGVHLLRKKMDCRVKPGNDAVERFAQCWPSARKAPSTSPPSTGCGNGCASASRSADDAAILVAEVACAVPGCPPIETVIAFWSDGTAPPFQGVQAGGRGGRGRPAARLAASPRSRCRTISNATAVDAEDAPPLTAPRRGRIIPRGRGGNNEHSDAEENPGRDHERGARPAGAGRPRQGLLQGRGPRPRVRDHAGHGAGHDLPSRQVRLGVRPPARLGLQRRRHRPVPHVRVGHHEARGRGQRQGLRGRKIVALGASMSKFAIVVSPEVEDLRARDAQGPSRSR